MVRSVICMYLFQLPEITSNPCNFGRGITLSCVSLRLHCTWGRETLWTMWIQWKQLVGLILCALHPDLYCISLWNLKLLILLTFVDGVIKVDHSGLNGRKGILTVCVKVKPWIYPTQTAVQWKSICPFLIFFFFCIFVTPLM